MKKISVIVQVKIKKLRVSGFTHRQIAKTLRVSQGTAANYSKDIHLTALQTEKINKENYNNSLGKLTKEEKLKASTKGGKNTPSQFPIKYTKEDLLQLLRQFYVKNNRIPTKRDFVKEYRAFLRVFKTWNKAINSAGFTSNPVLFSRKYVANDGHSCDSLAEKIIDDWLHARKISHLRKVQYLTTKFTADFKINNTYIEFFGLHGQLRSYDNLMKKKLLLVKDNNLKLISIYPADLFPKSRLETILNKFII